MKFENKKWEDVVYIYRKVLVCTSPSCLKAHVRFFSLSMYQGKILCLFAVTI